MVSHLVSKQASVLVVNADGKTPVQLAGLNKRLQQLLQSAEQGYAIIAASKLDAVEGAPVVEISLDSLLCKGRCAPCSVF